MTPDHRPSVIISRTPKGAIRALALVCAILGLVIITGIVVRNVLWQVPVPLVSMCWGVALLGLGCLMLQKGDVSTSLREWIDGAVRLRTLVFRATPASESAAASTACPHCHKLLVFCVCDEDPAIPSEAPVPPADAK